MAQEVDAISFLRQRYGGAQGQESQPSSAVDWLRSKYAPAPTPEGPGLTDYAGQSASSFAKGALDTGRMLLDFPATMGSAGAAMLGLNEVAETAKTLSPHYWAARGLQALERMVPTNEKVDAQQGGAGKWVSETGMNALGSTLPFLGLGMIAKGAGATTRAATALTALTGASVNAVSGYEDAIRSGATPEQAFGAMLVNGGLGTLEAATPARILARIDGKLGGRLGKAITDAFIEGGTEAMTEAIQQLGQDAYASMSFDERREVTQGLSDAAGGGGFAGVLMSLLGSGMARGHQQEASKVAPKEGVQPEPSQAAQEGPAQAPAMAEGTFSKPVETTDQRVQEAMQRISEKAGVPASVVEDQTGYEWEAERAKMAGSPLVLFRVGDGKATEGAPTGFSKGGVTYLNADLPEGSRRKAVLYHELTHRLAGEDQDSWRALHADLQANAPELLSKIGERYKASFGEDLTPEADAEESVAAFAEELPGFIRAWEENPGQFKETKRGFVRRIIDWITEKLGGTSSVKKELLALRDSIAETDLEKAADPALLRDVSRSFAAGLAELEKSKPAEPIEVRSTEADQVEPESMPPVAQQPVASRSPRAVGPSGPEAVKNPELYDEQGRPVVGSWSRGPQAIERSKPLTTKGEIDVEIPEDEPAYVPTKPNELTRRSKEELEADLEKALAIERERVKLVFEGRGKLWQERFIELRQSARRPSSPAQEAAAKQVRAVEAQLRPRALEVLQGGHEAGRNVEALMGALRYKELEAEASRLERRSGNREASRAAGERAQEAARRVGTEERFAVPLRDDQVASRERVISSDQVKPSIRSFMPQAVTEKDEAMLSMASDRVIELVKESRGTLPDSNTRNVLLRAIQAWRAEERELAGESRQASEVEESRIVGSTLNDMMDLSQDVQVQEIVRTISQQSNPTQRGERLPDVGRFSVAPKGRFDIPDESRSDKFLRKIQDRYIRLKRIQERIAKKQPVSEEANAEQKVRLFPSRLRDRYEKVEKFSNSVVEHLVKSGISVEDAGMFVYALGAEQRNATMAKRYPRKFGNVANPGSGITTAEAQKILRESYAKNKAGYEWIRDQVAAANKAKLDLAQQSGFLNDEARKKWEEDFGQYHAPLYTWEKDSEDAFTGYGSKSFNNAERITKTAKGRRSIADNPLVNLIDSMAKWSLRAESNRVGRSLGKLVEEAPDASLWEPIDSMSKAKPEDQVFTYWQDGQKRMVILHDAKLARAMKAIGVEPAGELLRLAQGIRTTYSKLHTSWNPEFIGPNLLKDTLAAAATLNLEQGPAFTAKALNPVRIKDSLMAIMADQHGREHKLSKDVVEWKERGGMTGWNLQPETLRKRFDQLEKQVDLAKKDTTGKHVVLAWLKGKKIVEDFSSAAENAVRFSVYRAFIEAGASPDEAARQSKTITIDFDSRGEISTPFNVMYLFFNANVQGTARIFQALKKAPPRRTAALAASMVSFGYLVSFLNRLMSDDDENGVNRWDTISQNDKAHNLSLMYGDRRVMLPQPWGWSLFTYMGQQAEQLQNGRYKSNEAVKDLLTQSADSFSPIQGSTPTQVVAPWFADPFIQVQENKDFAGRSIMPREDPFKRYQTPDSYRYFPDVNPSLKTAADALNRWTGGDQVEAGVLDISPETMEHLLGESAGGFGRAAMRVANLMDKGLRGEGIRPSEIPAVRRFYQEAPSWFTYSLFSDNLTEVEKQEEYRSQGMQFDAAVIGQGRATRNQIEKLNRAMKAVPEGPVRKRLEDRKLEIEQRFNKFMESRNK